jgi:hypothetical protein
MSDELYSLDEQRSFGSAGCLLWRLTYEDRFARRTRSHPFFDHEMLRVLFDQIAQLLAAIKACVEVGSNSLDIRADRAQTRPAAVIRFLLDRLSNEIQRDLGGAAGLLGAAGGVESIGLAVSAGSLRVGGGALSEMATVVSPEAGRNTSVKINLSQGDSERFWRLRLAESVYDQPFFAQPSGQCGEVAIARNQAKAVEPMRVHQAFERSSPHRSPACC